MAHRKRLWLSTLLELFLDAVLLLLFIGQAFVGTCLLIYGYLPLPTEWGNRLIAKNLPEGALLRAEEFRYRLDGRLELVRIHFRAEAIQQSLLEADLTEIELNWTSPFALPKLDSLLLSGGTLYIPSVYSPDGYQRPALERIALRLVPGEPHWEVDRFSALFDSIRLRGAFQIPIKPESSGSMDINLALKAFYTRVAKLSQQTERFKHFTTPTIAFKMELLDETTQRIDLRITSRTLSHPEAIAGQVQLRGSVHLQGLDLIPITPPRFSASHIEVPRYGFVADGIRAAIAPEQLSGLLSGNWPTLKLAARSIALQDYRLDAPILRIDPSAFPELRFNGATRGLNGALLIDGQLNTHRWDGNVRARGSVDLIDLAPASVRAKLPQIVFQSAPYYDLNARFLPGFSLDSAELVAQVNHLQVEGLAFDHISARAGYRDGLYAINDLYLRRARQWLDLKFSLDTNSGDYRTTLIGSAVPYEYNALLPRWWAAIFRDFDFSQSSYSLGDFIIYGNIRRKASDLYYGRAEAKGIAYKGVLLDSGSLIVRGRGPYTELHDLEATSGSGWARGNIAFASKLDDVQGPASVRLDMETQLTLGDAAKLFGGEIAAIIGDFQSTSLPVAQLKGAIFNEAYPQYAGKSYFDLSASSAAPLTFKEVPLDFLNLELYGRSTVTYLRNVRLGYAGGQGQSSIDVFTPAEGESTLRYHFSLTDADQSRALNSLPKLEQIENLGSNLKTEAPSGEMETSTVGRVQLQIHGSGPTDDPFAHQGFGSFEIQNDKLGTIQLLGPLSRVLESTQLNFTSFNLNRMTGAFSYTNDLVAFDPLHIDGPRTHIEAPGTLQLGDQALNMRVSASLFRNAGNPSSNLRKIGQMITKPLPNLLQFELTGTVQKQKFRSIYDPRNLIPIF